ncbi:MAG: PAS domain-containing protein [Desulfobacteraceae bacterium]|nr:PAS domain-containing protein [Desulfobacteraceae bacterium]
MHEKPSYKKLEQRVKNLERELESRKKTNAELTEIKQRYERLVNTIPCALYDYIRWPDGTTRFIYISPQCKRIFEYDADSIIENPDLLWNMVHFEDIERLKQEDLSANQAGKLFQSEVRIIPPSGKTKWIQLTSRPGTRKVDSRSVWSGIIIDITERKQAEEALAESEKKWRNILVNTPQIGVSIDTRGRIVFVNKHFLELTGWTEEEILGQDWFELLIPPEIQADIRGVFNQAMSGINELDFSSYENEIITRNGGRRYVAWSNVLTRDRHGDICEVTCLGIDLTERKKAEEELASNYALLRIAGETAKFGGWSVDLNTGRIT